MISHQPVLTMWRWMHLSILIGYHPIWPSVIKQMRIPYSTRQSSLHLIKRPSLKKYSQSSRHKKYGKRVIAIWLSSSISLQWMLDFASTSVARSSQCPQSTPQSILTCLMSLLKPNKLLCQVSGLIQAHNSKNYTQCVVLRLYPWLESIKT